MVINEESDEILDELEEFSLIFIQIVNLLIRRGYKYDGTEGRMREYIYYPEGFPGENQTYTWSLKRH